MSWESGGKRYGVCCAWCNRIMCMRMAKEAQTVLNVRWGFDLSLVMAALLLGLYEYWLQDPEVKHRIADSSIRDLVKTVDGSPIALQDRAHALLNVALIRPVLQRMSDCKTLVVNDVDEFVVQIIVLCAKMYDQEGISEDNAMDVEFEAGAYDELRVLAMGIKRCVAFDPKMEELLAIFGPAASWLQPSNSQQLLIDLFSLGAQVGYRDAPGASALHLDDYDPEIAEDPLTPRGLPVDLVASRERAAGNVFGPPRSNSGEVGPPLNMDVAGYIPGNESMNTGSGQSSGLREPLSAPPAVEPTPSCAGSCWEIKDSEDEDTEAEVLQIQEAVYEARARLHQLLLNAGPPDAPTASTDMDNMETQMMEVPTLDLPTGTGVIHLQLHVLTRMEQHDLKQKKKEKAAAKKSAAKKPSAKAVDDADMPGDTDAAGAADTESPQKVKKNRKGRKGKKPRKTKVSPKRSLLRRMSQHSFSESLPESSETASPPRSILKRRSSPNPSPASKKSKAVRNTKAAAKATEPKPAKDKTGTKAATASNAGKSAPKRKAPAKAPAKADEPKSSATEKNGAKRTRVGHFAQTCMTYPMHHTVLGAQTATSNQVCFQHDENTQLVKDLLGHFNWEEGNDTGSFKIIPYWSRGDMALSMKDCENKKLNAA
ncbi:unnamed protein product [Symbiodinium sp. CCMP2592]|nr:unnamed protein product [Symbiodinium sp. CCMP2592]